MMLSNVGVCRCALGYLGGHNQPCECHAMQVCFGQADLVMPMHSNVIIYQAGSVKLI